MGVRFLYIFPFVLFCLFCMLPRSRLRVENEIRSAQNVTEATNLPNTNISMQLRMVAGGRFTIVIRTILEFFGAPSVTGHKYKYFCGE